jgi:hypothetical protein
MKQSGQLGNVGIAASDRCKTENAPCISSQRPETCRKVAGDKEQVSAMVYGQARPPGDREQDEGRDQMRPRGHRLAGTVAWQEQSGNGVGGRWPLIGVLFFPLSAFGATSGLPKRVLILQSFVRDTPPFSQAAAFRTALAQELTHQLVWAAELHRRTCGFHHRGKCDDLH